VWHLVGLRGTFCDGLRVLENKRLRRIFRPKREEGTGEWRKLHTAS
jgi:hypothetical protein